jgi:ABC-2 type transport system permease protein
MSKLISAISGATRNVRIIMKKELRSYFASPIAYIVITLFLLVIGFFSFITFFLANQTDTRRFFELLPLFFSLVIPAITMRLFSEELSTGSYEMLVTMPLSTADIVVGKFLSGSVFVILMLVPTIVYPITIAFVGTIDIWPIIGGYIGAILLGAAYVSLGILASSMSKNQIISFFVALAFCLLLTMIDKITVFFPDTLVSVLGYIGADYHFKSIARGVIDLRDIIYFASVIGLSVLGTIRIVEERR